MNQKNSGQKMHQSVMENKTKFIQDLINIILLFLNYKKILKINLISKMKKYIDIKYINYFYDKVGQNVEDMDQIFYTNFYKEKYNKRIKVNNKNKYNSLLLNDVINAFTQKIPTKTINSIYIRKNPINLAIILFYNYNI